MVTIDDCGTVSGSIKMPIYKGEKLVLSLAQAIRGRTARRLSLIAQAIAKMTISQNPDCSRSIAALPA